MLEANGMRTVLGCRMRVSEKGFVVLWLTGCRDESARWGVGEDRSGECGVKKLTAGVVVRKRSS